MTNSEVFYMFADRQEAKGGSVRSERTPYGVVLYSYATPIAVFADTDAAPVFTTRKFSVTTSKQQAQARRACFHVIDLDDETFRTVAARLGADFRMAR